MRRGFEPQSGKTKDYSIGICHFSAKHAEFRCKSKNWIARNQDIVLSGATFFHLLARKAKFRKKKSLFKQILS
jgi:hypothetical protein